MKTSPSKGFTLVEMMIGGILMVFAIAAGLTVFNNAFKTQNDATKRLRLSQATNLFTGHLQKNMATGDTKFMGFSGKAPADRTLGRLIIPMVGRCANLSTVGCEQDTSLIYVDYNKTTAPAVTVICADVLTTPDPYLVVDVDNDTYGDANHVAGKFVIPAGAGTFASGEVPISVNSTLALLSPPIAVIWQVRLAESPIVVTEVSPGVVNFGPSVAPPGCAANMRKNPVTGAFITTGLFKIPIQPWIMINATTAVVAPTPDAKNSTLGAFPQRMFQAKFRTLGRMPSGSGSFVMLNCTSSSIGNLICPSTNPLLSIPNVSRVEIEFAFVLNLYTGGTAAAPTPTILADKFMLTSTTFTAPNCILPTCAKIPWDSNIPVLASEPYAPGTAFAETADKLNQNNFSLLKMEALKRIQFSLFDDKQKEVNFNVLF